MLLIEASTNKMCWRIINSAKSACMMISLQSRFFEHYLLYDVALMTASVLLKVSEMLDIQQSVLCLGSTSLNLKLLRCSQQELDLLCSIYLQLSVPPK